MHKLALSIIGAGLIGGGVHLAHIRTSQPRMHRPRIHLAHSAQNLGSYRKGGFVLSNRGRSFLR